MRRALVFVLAFVATGAFAADRGLLPADAARLASRIELCIHFAGEFNGDRSARDREVTRRMNALHCNRIQHDAAAMRRHHARNTAVQRAMDAASGF